MECEESGVQDDTSELLGRASTKFFIDLYRVSQTSSASNYLVSPYSIFTSLSLLQLGARGPTKARLAQLLHFDNKVDIMHRQASNFIDTLDLLTTNSNGSITLQSANSVYLDSSITAEKVFIDAINCLYRSDVTSLELQKEPKHSAEIINNWIVEKTLGKIRDLIDPDVLEDSQVILLNTVYFRASWRLPFNRGPKVMFTQESGSQVEVDMMILEGLVATVATPTLHVVELDYAMACDGCSQTDVAMYLFVPREGVTVSEAEAGFLQEKILSGQALKLEQQSLRLEMPRFEIRHREQNLGKVLGELGLPLGGDFGGISRDPLLVSEVMHEAVLR